MSEQYIQTPSLPFAIVAYDRNHTIGYGDHMPYSPREELLTDNQHMWAILTNPDREVSLIGGSATMLPLLGILPPAIKDVIVVTKHPENMPSPLADRVRTADDPVVAVDMALKAGRVPAIFGGASIYNNDRLRARLYTVLATEIDAAFVDTTGQSVKKFNPLPVDQWSVVSNEPMPRGPKDHFAARFVEYERVAQA